MLGDWEAHLTDDFMRGGRRLHVFRRIDHDRLDMIVQFGEGGEPVMETLDTHTSGPPGLFLPASAIESLGRLVNPGPSQRELDRVTEALKVERARVDQVLDRRVGFGD